MRVDDSLIEGITANWQPVHRRPQQCWIQLGVADVVNVEASQRTEPLTVLKAAQATRILIPQKPSHPTSISRLEKATMEKFP